MPRFVVNRKGQAAPGRDHEVHNLTIGCEHLPDIANQVDLGEHVGCHGAVQRARLTYPEADGCYYCCRDCHAR